MVKFRNIYNHEKKSLVTDFSKMVRLQEKRHRNMLNRIGKCVNFGCETSGARAQMKTLVHDVAASWPRLFVLATNMGYARTLPPSLLPCEASETLHSGAELEDVARLLAGRANRKLLELWLSKALLPGSLLLKKVGVTKHMRSEMFNVDVPTPSTLIGFSRFGICEHEGIHRISREKERIWQSFSGRYFKAIPPAWRTRRAPGEPGSGDPEALANCLVMQSCIFSVATRKFVGVVRETIEVNTQGRATLQELALERSKEMEKYVKGVEWSRFEANQKLIAINDGIKGLARMTRKGVDALDDLDPLRDTKMNRSKTNKGFRKDEKLEWKHLGPLELQDVPTRKNYDMRRADMMTHKDWITVPEGLEGTFEEVMARDGARLAARPAEAEMNPSKEEGLLEEEDTAKEEEEVWEEEEETEMEEKMEDMEEKMEEEWVEEEETVEEEEKIEEEVWEGEEIEQKEEKEKEEEKVEEEEKVDAEEEVTDEKKDISK